MVLALSLIAPVHGATLDVPATYGTVNGAIAAASDGDTIAVAAGTYSEDIVIDKIVHIVCDGATLAGGASGSGVVVNVFGGEIATIRGCIVEGGSNYRNFRVNAGAELLLDNVESADVSAPNDGFGGGAMFVSGGQVITYDSQFHTATLNTAYNGGVIWMEDGELELNDTSVEGGTAQNGGNIYVEDTKLRTDGASITLGDALNRGGGIYAIQVAASSIDPGHVRMKGTLLEGNHANGRGGGMYAEDLITRIEDADFIDNDTLEWGGHLFQQSGAIFLLRGSYDGGIASVHGGFLYSRQATTVMRELDVFDTVGGSMGPTLACETCTYLDVVSSSFTGNESTGSGGGAIRSWNHSTMRVIDSTFDSNTAATIGGDISVAGGAAGITIASNTFRDSTAGTTGGSIRIENNNGAILIADNVFDTTYAATQGGAIWLTASDATLERNLFCHVENDNGNDGGAIQTFGSTITFSNNVLVGTYTADDGGVEVESGSSVIRNNDFLSSQSGDDGSAFRGASGGTTTEFTNNLVAWGLNGPNVDGGSTFSGGYNYFFSNAGNNLGGGATATTNNITGGGDPQLTTYTHTTPTSNIDCLGADFVPVSPTSPLINAGNPAIQDPDGSTSDIGAYGGPGAAGYVDGDGDGVRVDWDCNDADGTVWEDITGWNDGDGDGYGDPTSSATVCGGVGLVDNNLDCDDSNGAVNPDTLWYLDADGDGAGDANWFRASCTQPPGYVASDTDCDDANASVILGGTWYHDFDGDGFGDPLDSLVQCGQPTDYVADNTDCNDADIAINPNTTWYHDFDQDGFGDPADTITQCVPLSDYIADNTDCNDADVTINPDTLWYLDTDFDGFGNGTTGIASCTDPGGGRIRDGSDCDDIDPDAFPGAQWYLDDDMDGYGDPNDAATSCLPLSGRVADDTDCNDNAIEINPATIWYEDFDSDGFGDSTSTMIQCQQPTGFVLDATDCDDDDDTLGGPFDHWADSDDDGYGDAAGSASSVCPGPGRSSNNQDCDDGDDTLNPDTVWYADGDSDGFGDAFDTLSQCLQPSGYVRDDTDCAPGDTDVNPGATEVCNGIDDNCVDGVDDADPALDLGTASTWYEDGDNDNFGTPSVTTQACLEPNGYADNDEDCDDSDPTTNPSAPEQCDDEDHDCDGAVDNDIVFSDWYPDVDDDGYGDDSVTPTNDCIAPPDTVSVGGDCDDIDDAVNPDATEVCDGVDNDCDGTSDVGAIDALTFYADLDGDTYGDGVVLACSQPPDTALVAGDCDDSDSGVNPGELEFCDGVDQDCNGQIDDGAQDATFFWPDDDDDGFGGGVPVVACTAPSGHVDNDSDCDDTDADTYPGATEFCDGDDDDCNTLIDDNVTYQDWWADEDADGFGDPDDVLNDCAQPDDYVDNDLDCNDGNASVNPDETERWYDGVDQDCDGNDDDQDFDGLSVDDDCDDTDPDVGECAEVEIPDVSPRADEVEVANVPVAGPSGCNCSSSGGGGAGLLALLGALAFVRRR